MGNIRAILWEWGHTEEKCRRLQSEIKEFQLLIEDARRMAAVVSDGMPKGTETGNPTERRAMAALKLEEEYSDTIESLQAQISDALYLKATVDELLQELTPTQREVVSLRYKEGRSWTSVAMRFGITEYAAKGYDQRTVEKLKKFFE